MSFKLAKANPKNPTLVQQFGIYPIQAQVVASMVPERLQPIFGKSISNMFLFFFQKNGGFVP